MLYHKPRTTFSIDHIRYGEPKRASYRSAPLDRPLSVEGVGYRVGFEYDDKIWNSSYSESYDKVSVRAITDEGGEVLQRMNYTPYGRLAHADGKPYTRSEERMALHGGALMFGRGYTGHEHLLGLGLINMNARLYDPYVGRFLSPDPNVQLPDFLQNLNRYSYCLNNPLKYTDPTGEIVWFVPVIIGAVIGAASYTARVAFSPAGFNNWRWGSFVKSVGLGAFTGAFTAGIGSTFGAIGSYGIAAEFGRVALHGMVGGAVAGINGGNVGSGFTSGAFSSLAGSLFMMYGGSLATSQVGTYSFSAFAGGTASELSGGSFIEGAAFGLMNAGLNHLEQGINKLIYKKTFKRLGFVPLDEKVGYQMAAYKMKIRIWENGDNQLTISADTYNTKVEGQVVANAEASIIGNGKKLATQSLTLKSDTVYPSGGFKPIGSASFARPDSARTSIGFRGGWVVYLPGGASVPVYHPLVPWSININKQIPIF